MCPTELGSPFAAAQAGAAAARRRQARTRRAALGARARRRRDSTARRVRRLWRPVERWRAGPGWPRRHALRRPRQELRSVSRARRLFCRRHCHNDTHLLIPVSVGARTPLPIDTQQISRALAQNACDPLPAPRVRRRVMREPAIVHGDVTRSVSRTAGGCFRLPATRRSRPSAGRRARGHRVRPGVCRRVPAPPSSGFAREALVVTISDRAKRARERGPIKTRSAPLRARNARRRYSTKPPVPRARTRPSTCSFASSAAAPRTGTGPTSTSR